MKHPFFSIIVLSHDAGTSIAMTLSSVLQQDFTDMEIIVKYAQSQEDFLGNIPDNPLIQIYSETDAGVYDAMNQALNYSNGKYVLFLACGDELYDSSVLRCVHWFVEDCAIKPTIVYGDYKCADGHIEKQPSEMTAFGLYRKPLCRQTVFIRRDLFAKFGEFDLQYQLCADYEFIARCFERGAVFGHVAYPICDCVGNGISDQNNDLLNSEIETIRDKYFDQITKIRYEIYKLLSFSGLRAWLASDKSPVTT